GLSILATLFFGKSAKQGDIIISVFSTGEQAVEISEKWVDLLNESVQLKFKIVDEQEAKEDVKEGRRDVAVHVMEDDYRLFTMSELPTVQLVQEHVHRIFTEEAMLQAATSLENRDEVRKNIDQYMENPPLQAQTVSLEGKE